MLFLKESHFFLLLSGSTKVHMASTASKFTLYFEAEGLADTDTLSKSDPYLVLYQLPPPDLIHAYGGQNGGGARAAPTIVGRTETIKNKLNPKFKNTVEVLFYFESRQDFRVSLFDDDGKGAGDDLGSADFQLSHVMTARNKTLKLNLSKKGSVTITGIEQMNAGGDTVSFTFAGTAMKKMDTFSASDCYFKISRRVTSTKLDLLYQSEVVDDSLEPRWRPTRQIPVGALTGADLDEPTIFFECFDQDTVSDEPMGKFVASFNQLQAAAKAFKDQVDVKAAEFHLFDDNKKPFGTIILKEINIVHQPTFAEYLHNGWQISLAVSVDFTGSNGTPASSTSLHQFAQGMANPNQYVRALIGVGEILLQYDTDKQVPFFGYGASINGRTEHFFHINQQPNPYVAGVRGMIDTYYGFVPHAMLSGPTNFAPTILSATKGARDTASEKCYTVLLILTDGDITDMDATVDAIVEADDAPLSIIIVGVGNGSDFKAMDQLDGDGQKLQGRRRQSRRDIVQFVPYRNFINAPVEALSAEVLREVPNQFLEYIKLAGRQII